MVGEYIDWLKGNLRKIWERDDFISIMMPVIAYYLFVMFSIYGEIFDGKTLWEIFGYNSFNLNNIGQYFTHNSLFLPLWRRVEDRGRCPRVC